MENKFTDDEIVSIEYVGVRETIDITVSHDNLFVANGILTHNCAYGEGNPGMEGLAESIAIAATADSLTSIFQSEEDLELGIIRCGKMKNRFGPRGMVQAMKIDYSTLTVYQSDEEMETMDEEELTLLERLELR